MNTAADFGIKVAQSGSDISNAADYQFVLDSDWPMLLIYKVVDVGSIASGAAQDTLVYSHGLDYAPPFLAFIDGQSPNSSGQVNLSNPAFTNFYSNSNGIYYNRFGPGLTKGFIVIFAYDIVNTSFQTKTTGIPGQNSSTPDANGLEIAAANSDLNTTNPNNFQLTTSDRPMQINSSGPLTQSGVEAIEVIHGLGYTPVWLLFQIIAGNLYPAECTVISTLDSLSFSGIQAPLETCYYLILKDAFEAVT